MIKWLKHLLAKPKPSTPKRYSGAPPSPSNFGSQLDTSYYGDMTPNQVSDYSDSRSHDCDSSSSYDSGGSCDSGGGGSD